MGLENVQRCRHVKADGTQCGSPALRRRRLCYFHRRVQDMKVRILTNQSPQGRLCLPVLEDANGVQMALMQVLEQLAWGRIDHKTAGLMLYALQTASANMRNTRFEVRDPTDVVIDRDTVRWTHMGGPQWVEEDFDEEEEDDAEQQDEGSEESKAVVSPLSHRDTEKIEEIEKTGENKLIARPEAEDEDGTLVGEREGRAAGTVGSGGNQAKKKPSGAAKPPARKVNMDQARENVKGLFRNWIMETVVKTAGRETGG